MKRVPAAAAAVVGLLAGMAAAPRPLPAYSVLTHEAVVDAAWDSELLPLLRQRYPSATPDQLVRAHAYLYGGALIQDLGYYPFSNKLFSDLVHYVRAGDFITALLDEAQNLDEYAFALGALAHYCGDRDGHSQAVNPAVALTYPKLRHKFGPIVTFAQNPSAHLKTEFAFDVVMAVSGHYAPKAYHDFIGFQVSRPVLERAFRRTYGLDLSDLFADLDLVLGTYRHSVGVIIPNMTKVAWQLHKDDITRAMPGVKKTAFVYRLPGRVYRHDFGRDYRTAGAGTRILAFFIRLVPRAGIFRGLGFQVPPPPAESLFVSSVQKTSAEYHALLAGLRERRTPHLANINLDTGAAVPLGGYGLADTAFTNLVERLAARHFSGADARLSGAILAHFRPASGTAAQSVTPPPQGSSRKARAAAEAASARLAAWLKELDAREPAGAPHEE